ncbi:MAG: response regulator [Rhodospirillaceae bacterium]|nr:response regulator [Rhodospirillaceae bacterium]
MAKILLIEDDALLAGVMEAVLRKAGYTVVTIPNGGSALAKLEGENPDLVITDLIMPEKEGIETIRAIREKDEHVPIVAYSGGGVMKNYDFLKMAVKLGANDALCKPFANEELLAAVKRLLENGTV